MKGLTTGRMVHFVTEDNVHLPAIVVKVWNESGVINLTAFIDHATYTGDNTFSQTSVPYSEEPAPHTWHWIEPA